MIPAAMPLRRSAWSSTARIRIIPGTLLIANHPHFVPPDNNLTDALFGCSTETLASSLGSGGANGGLNRLYQIGGPRSIQLALKLQF